MLKYLFVWYGKNVIDINLFSHLGAYENMK